MKLSILVASALSLPFIANANSALSQPDGYKYMSNAHIFDDNGVFKYCDRPSADLMECYDQFIPSIGPTEKTLSKWRTAQEYIKYRVGNDFIYTDLKPDLNGVYLLYKKS